MRPAARPCRANCRPTAPCHGSRASLPRLQRAVARGVDPPLEHPRRRLRVLGGEVPLERHQDGAVLLGRDALGDLEAPLVLRPFIISPFYRGMFPCLRAGIALPLRGQHPERLDQPGPRLGGLDHVVDEPALGGRVRRRELVAVLADQVLRGEPRVGRLLDLLAEDDVDRALRAHHRDLGGRPGERHVGAEVLRVHDEVRTAVGLAS